MTIYSHSRLEAFDQCPYKYKLKYIDKVKVDIPTTIEAFMGDLVHQALERLHAEKLKGVLLSMDQLIEWYLSKWQNECTEDILIAKKDQGLTSESYKLMGLKFLTDYYMRKKPFDGRQIIGLETKNRLRISEKDEWYVMIDKLEKDGEGNYFVCDYKTNARMKSKDEADADRQLAMYAAWVNQHFPDAKNVILQWDMLAFNKEITSTRTKQQLFDLQNSVVKKIKEIENTQNFPRKPSALCNYCVFKEICPATNPNTAVHIPTTITQQKLGSF